MKEFIVPTEIPEEIEFYEEHKLQEIVRCKDCKHWYPLAKTCNNVDGACCQSYVADDWFCADGEREKTT